MFRTFFCYACYSYSANDIIPIITPAYHVGERKKDNNTEFHDWALSLIIGTLENCLSLFN